MTARRRRSGRLAPLLVAALAAAGLIAPNRAPVTAAEVTSRFARLDSPIRVLDTRQGGPIGRLPAGGAVSIDPVTVAVAASAGVAETEVVAIVATVTLDGADGWGYATVYPTGEGRPDSSSINTDALGQTVANTVTARRGGDGRITIYSSIGADLLVDVQGVYVRAAQSRTGRFVGVAPRRAADTRPNPTPAGGVVTVDLTPSGLPSSASAAVLNVTAVDAQGWGFLTVWDGVGAPPNASNVNYVAGSNVANQVISAHDGGRVAVYTYAATDILVDVVGYMTGPDDPVSTNGLFVPLSPGRVLDTRSGAPTFGAPIGDGGRLAVGVLGKAGIPVGRVAAINTNATITETAGTGFATVWGDGELPPVSSLNNVGAGRTIANHVIADITDIGCVNVHRSSAAHAIVDITGYFLGDRAGPAFAPLDLCDGTLTPPPAQPGLPPAFGQHAFLFTPTPAPYGYGRWDPCRPGDRIPYAVNILRATQRDLDEMIRALREIEQATGFDFVPYRADPTTTEGLRDHDPPRGADFLIAFSDPAQTPELSGGVIGIGGGFWFPDVGEIDRGYAIVDTPQLGDTNSMRATLLHEIAHAIGLGHVNDTNQLMYPALTGRASFGNGDREGLWRVNAVQQCFPERRPAADPVRVESALGFADAGAGG